MSALSYKYLLIDQNYKLAVLDDVLCNVEYQPDGSSNNMFRQYLKNPKGFAFWRDGQDAVPGVLQAAGYGLHPLLLQQSDCRKPALYQGIPPQAADGAVYTGWMGTDGVYQEKGEMKHTLLIFSQAMELGGVERSLLGLLDSIDYDHYDVDLFLMRHSGELMPYLNPKANLLPEIPQYTSLAVPMVSLLKSGQIGVLCGRLRGKLAAKRFDKRHPSSKPSVTALTYSHKFTLSCHAADFR